jgi:two-component system sensor histidine kinase ChvG
VRGAVVRVTEKGELIVSVAVPVQRFRAVVGVLLLSTQAGDIDQIVHGERLAIMRVFGVATMVNVILSLLLSSTIANPLRRLAAAAIRVRRGVKSREEIPDFSFRQDEIGNLSSAIREMTNSLYDRIAAIESFAADVSHELKNPLTSLRSAVETLPLAKSEDSKKRLLDIIQHDVRRLDRLISDISNASRLDGELAREVADRVDVEKLAETMVSIQHDLASKRNVDVVLDKRTGRFAPIVLGHDSRLAQVFSNLIDNAVSFSPDDGVVRVAIATVADQITITITDEGPGIRGDITRIFQRFYTDRPEGEHFGDHSGLGLSISRQIIEAHKGTIEVRNRTDRSGAIFTITLPRAANERPAPKARK